MSESGWYFFQIKKLHIDALKPIHCHLAGNCGDDSVNNECRHENHPHRRVAKGVSLIEEFQSRNVVEYFSNGNQ